ncbi:MAG: ABC-F family ATP-binding cassette domain-containing protein, partial [Planctomycetes bacterium]|nr:ABC-F family ATP-binding cassette domain-containing protein [Planctomycetota bacterium]
MALINLQDVTKQFGTHLVLDGVCLDLHPGERAGLIGPNGSGKTTILRLIAGEMAPDTGQVTVSKGLKVAVLAQDPVIDPDRSLHDEVLSVFSDLLKMEQDLHALSEKMASTSGDTELQELMARYDRCNERFVAAGGHKFETKLNEILGGLGFVPAEYSLSVGVVS